MKFSDPRKGRHNTFLSFSFNFLGKNFWFELNSGMYNNSTGSFRYKEFNGHTLVCPFLLVAMSDN